MGKAAAKEPPEEEVERKLTLRELLDIFDEFDQGLRDFDPEEMAKMADLQGDKIDGYEQVISRFKAEEKRLREHAAQFEKAAQVVKGKWTRIEAILKYHMGEKGLKKLPGKAYQVKRTVTEHGKLIPKASAKALLTPQTFMKFEKLGIIKRSYSWVADPIKSLIKIGKLPEELKPHFETIDSVSVGFDPKKED